MRRVSLLLGMGLALALVQLNSFGQVVAVNLRTTNEHSNKARVLQVNTVVPVIKVTDESDKPWDNGPFANPCTLTLSVDGNTHSTSARMFQRGSKLVCQDCREGATAEVACPERSLSRSALNPRFCQKSFWVDLNGDGITDFICVEGAGSGKGRLWLQKGSIRSLKYTLSDFPKSPALPFHSTCAHEGGKFYTADLNGDKKSDMYCTVRGVAYVAFSRGDGTLAPVTANNKWGGVRSLPCPAQSRTILEDITGDGKADLICVDSSRSGSMWLFKGSGNGVFTQSSRLKNTDLSGKFKGYPTCERETGGRVEFHDVDGDGLKDYVCTVKSQGMMWIWLNKGNGNFHANNGGWVVYKLSPPCPSRMKTVDVNGDGKADIVCERAGGLFEYFTYNPKTPNKLSNPQNRRETPCKGEVQWVDMGLKVPANLCITK